MISRNRATFSSAGSASLKMPAWQKQAHASSQCKANFSRRWCSRSLSHECLDPPRSHIRRSQQHSSWNRAPWTVGVAAAPSSAAAHIHATGILVITSSSSRSRSSSTNSPAARGSSSSSSHRRRRTRGFSPTHLSIDTQAPPSHPHIHATVCTPTHNSLLLKATAAQ